MNALIRKLLFAVSFSLLFFSADAQNQKYAVGGSLIDTAGLPLVNASAVLLQLPDSTLSGFGISDDQGGFNMRNLKAGDYVLQVAYLGFATYNQNLTLPAEGGNLNTGIIIMVPETKLLGEVTVKADHIPIMFKKDTIEYNANAFQVQPNDNVEDLLKKLPGVEIDRDGSIKAQGEEVQNVLVDGKEFFGDDPKIATKNLPADAVDKVQVFDKKSEMAEFSGIDDGREEKTINLELKEDKKQGWFGKISGGYGTQERYDGRLNLNRFSNKLQFSAIGLANNVNETGFSINDYINFMGGLRNLMSGGGGKLSLQIGGPNSLPISNGLSDGLAKSAAGGINFNYDIGKRTEIRSSYFYNAINSRNEVFTDRQNFLEDGSYYFSEERNEANKSYNHRLNVSVKHELDSVSDIRLKATLGFNDGLLSQSSFSQTMDALNQIQNESMNQYDSEGDRMTWETELTYRRRFNRKGRVLSVSGMYGKEDDQSLGTLSAANAFYTGPIPFGDTILQRQDQLNIQDKYNVYVSYVEPLGGRKYLELNYNRQNFQDDTDRKVYDLSPNVVGEESLNSDLTYRYIRDYTYDRAGMNFKWNQKNFNLGLGGQYQRSSLNGNLVSEEALFTKEFHTFLPSARFDWDLATSRSIYLSYNTNLREPSLQEMQPIIDNNDPINIYVGNPDLRPEYQHRLRLNFNSFSQFSMTSLFASFNTTLTNNTIVQARTIDSLFRQITEPLNAEQSSQYSGSLHYGFPLRFLGSRVSFNADGSFTKRPTYVNSLPTTTKQTMLGFSVDLENNKKSVLDWMVGFSWNSTNAKYTLEGAQDQKYVDYSPFASLTLNLGKTWKIDTDFDMKVYTGDAFEVNQTIPIWKASISKFIFENQKGEIRLSVFDLLDENKGISRTSNLNYIEERRSLSLGRYFMVGFHYKLTALGSEEGSIINIRDRR